MKGPITFYVDFLCGSHEKWSGHSLSSIKPYPMSTKADSEGSGTSEGKEQESMYRCTEVQLYLFSFFLFHSKIKPHVLSRLYASKFKLVLIPIRLYIRGWKSLPIYAGKLSLSLILANDIFLCRTKLISQESTKTHHLRCEFPGVQ